MNRVGVALGACLSLMSLTLIGVQTSATAHPVRQESPATVDIVSVGDPVHQSGDGLQIEVRITNTAADPLTYSATASAQPTVPWSRDHLTEWITGTTEAVDMEVLHTVEAIDLDPGQSELVTFEVAGEDLTWGRSTSDWGPRGIEIAVTDPTGATSTARTFITTAPSFELPPMDYTVIVPLTATAAEIDHAPYAENAFNDAVAELPAASEPGDVPTETATEDEAPTGPPPLGQSTTEGREHPATEALTEVLDALTAPGVTVGVDAAIAAPNRSTGLIEPLRDFASASDHQLFLLPGLDADIAALAHGGRRAVFIPHILLMNRTAFALAQEGFARPPVNIAYPLPGLDSVTATQYASDGMRRFVIPDTSVPESDPQYWTPPAATTFTSAGGSEFSGVVIDTHLSQLLAGQITDADGETISLDPLTARQMLLAATAIHYRERPNDPRPVVLALDRRGMPDLTEIDPALAAADANQALGLDNLAATLDALAAAPWFAPAVLTEIMDGPTSAATRQSLPVRRIHPGELTPDPVTDLVNARIILERIGSVTDSPRLFVEPGEVTTDLIAAGAWRTAPELRQARISSVESLATSLSATISIEESSTINIIAQESQVPVLVTSNLPTDAVVTVFLESRDQRLQFEPVETHLPAHSRVQVLVPFTAYGSGNVDVTATVLAEDGEQLTTSTMLKMRVRADWENLGTGLVAAAVGVVLLIGIVRSARRGPRVRPVAAEDAPETSPEAASSEVIRDLAENDHDDADRGASPTNHGAAGYPQPAWPDLKEDPRG